MKLPFYVWRKQYALRLRALRSMRDLSPVRVQRSAIEKAQYLCFITLRNEALRLPYFLNHHRAFGVQHFVVVDNDSTDESRSLLLNESDVSLWHTNASYRKARFGMDWMNALRARFGANKWCLTLDADEALIYDGCDQHDLHALTRLLEKSNQRAFGALMVELFSKGQLSEGQYQQGMAPEALLNWFDAAPYWQKRKEPMQNLILQGGPRARVFFANTPNQAPTLNKLPLIKHTWGDVYHTSTHSALPVALNLYYDGPSTPLAGALLHSKFLPDVPKRAVAEKARKQHFETPQKFDDYYAQLAAAPELWHDDAKAYRGAESLIQAGLIPRMPWGPHGHCHND